MILLGRLRNLMVDGMRWDRKSSRPRRRTCHVTISTTTTPIIVESARWNVKVAIVMRDRLTYTKALPGEEADDRIREAIGETSSRA